MSSAEDYLKRLKKLSTITIKASTAAEAKAALADVRVHQKQLRQLKREINLDMKEIRAAHAAKADSAGSGGAALFWPVWEARRC